MGISSLLVYIGSFVIFAWGVSHIIPTNSVVKSFELNEIDQRRILKMEWVSEGLTLCFIGILSTVVNIYGNENIILKNAILICLSGMLFVMAAWTQLTGAKTNIIPIKICPIVKSAVAIIFIISIAMK
jgi:hypothetical protein